MNQNFLGIQYWGFTDNWLSIFPQEVLVHFIGQDFLGIQYEHMIVQMYE